MLSNDFGNKRLSTFPYKKQNSVMPIAQMSSACEKKSTVYWYEFFSPIVATCTNIPFRETSQLLPAASRVP